MVLLKNICTKTTVCETFEEHQLEINAIRMYDSSNESSQRTE